MKCDGHAKITDATIALLLKNCAHDPAIRQEHCNANFFVTDETSYTDPEKSVSADNTSTAIKSAIYGNAKFESTGPFALLLMFLAPQNYRANAGWQPHKVFCLIA
ncbi:hypothetical protein [Thalassomonas haliotis]|uniref:Uncharacterized protein n=1 Tax=Thalassomonas haliotis TaxID=485448 RepID=A0ABY7VJ66_9GAMM|nr:hypothetical protein [Thalassomonas haliotis]WDE13506.1 hypothetical protein H3N35_08750 [Thalassomonas haliotis]